MPRVCDGPIYSVGDLCIFWNYTDEVASFSWHGLAQGGLDSPDRSASSPWKPSEEPLLAVGCARVVHNPSLCHVTRQSAATNTVSVLLIIFIDYNWKLKTTDAPVLIVDKKILSVSKNTVYCTICYILQ